MTSFKTPSLFSTLIGNPRAKDVLTRLLSHQALPTVLLFHGPDGVGKGHFALEIAQTLVGKTSQHHPDIHILRPDPESDQHPIAQIRDLLQETSLPPFEAPCKIFILHDAEKMLPSSSNPLLKTLEEPPPRTYFILLTSQLSSLLPTIVSRCSKVPFFPVSDDELTAFLTAKFHTLDGKKISHLAQGSVARALRRLSHPPLLPLDDLFRAKTYTQLHEMLSKIEDLDDLSHEAIDHLFEEILYHIREHDPLALERAVPLISEARLAHRHHIKLKNILEQFFIRQGASLAKY